MRFTLVRLLVLPLLAAGWMSLPAGLMGQLSKAVVPEELQSGWDTISPEQASEFLHVLAGPEFEGRGTGQTGYTKAALWVADQLKEFGLKPMGEGGTYFQTLPMSRLTLDADLTSLSGPNGITIPLGAELGLDRFSDVGELSGELVVVSLRGQRPVLDENVSLRDKFVIFTSDDELAARAPFILARAGAVAALRVTDEDATSGTPLQRDGAGQRDGSGVSGTIRRDAAEKLIAAAGGEASWMNAEGDAPFAAHVTERKMTLKMRVRQESAEVFNVIGLVEGSDPAFRDEYIVIGSHLDHLGMRGGTMYPGADDNGSGSTAVLSIARAMANNPVKPKRSVLFIWFAAEEIGLVGSAHYVDHPQLPLEKMVCMFNIDMVGRNEEKDGEPASENLTTIHLVGSKRGDTGLHDVIMRANECVNFDFEYDEEGVFGRSDQANFYKKGTSVAFLFGGFHPDYHQPGDTADKINYDKIAAAAKLFYLSIHYAAEHGPFPRPAEEPTEDAAKPESAAMADSQPHQGLWVAKSLVVAGNALPPAVVQTITLTVMGDTYEVNAGGQLDKGSCVVDAKASPKRMTITGQEGPNKGNTFLAIFETVGEDELRVCYDLTGKEYPSTFESTEENALFSATYSRKK